MINDIKKIQSRLGKDLNSLTRMLDTTLAQLPEESLKEVSEVRGDMQRVLNGIKSGDTDVANEIIKKYGNSSR